MRLAAVVGTTADRATLCRASPAPHGPLAYAAGAVVVLHDLAHDKQLAFLHHGSNNAVAALAFSADGAYLAVGEVGHDPRVLVWDTASFALVCEVAGAHRFGIACVAFAPRQPDLIVSVGVPHDGALMLHNWRTGKKVASNKISSKVHAAAFLADGLTFVTAGHRHLKYWSLHGIDEFAGRGRAVAPQLVEGRSAVLGDYREATFVDVLADEVDNRLFAFTSAGVLCSLGPNRTIERWVGLKAPTSFCLTRIGQYLACGCNDGVVRLFRATDFKYVTTLPRAHSLPRADDEDESTKRVWPDCVAVSGQGAHLVTCLYSDRSLVQWNIAGLDEAGEATPAALSRKIEPQRGLRFPSSAVWDLAIVETEHGPRVVTAASDGCLHVADVTVSTMPSSGTAARVVPVQPNIGVLQRRHSGIVDTAGSMVSTTDARGLRCLRQSKDGKLAVTGDRGGNLIVLDTAGWTRLGAVAAHDSEVVALDVCVVKPGERWLIASGSRDRLIHLFEASFADASREQLELVPTQTFDEHTSAITALCFGAQGTSLASSGADKSVIFRTRASSASGARFVLQHHHAMRQTVLDMAVSQDGASLVVVGQDKRIALYDVPSGQPKRSFKVDGMDQATVAVALDSSGTVAFLTTAGKNMHVVDLATETLLVDVRGPGELVTAVQYMPKRQRLVCASADGCVFHWQLSPSLCRLLAERAGSAAQPTEKENQGTVVLSANLPSWLRNKLDGSAPSPAQPSQPPFAFQQGRWAAPRELQVHSEAKGASVVVNLSKPLNADRRLTIEPEHNGAVASVYDTFSQRLEEDEEAFARDAALAVGDAPVYVSVPPTPSRAEALPVDSDVDAPASLTAKLLSSMVEPSKEPTDEDLQTARPSLSSRFLIGSRSAKANRVPELIFADRMTTEPPAPAVATTTAPAPLAGKKRDRSGKSMAEEVERTRMLLAKMGMAPGAAADPADKPLATTPAKPEPAPVKAETTPAPVRSATPPKAETAPVQPSPETEPAPPKPTSLLDEIAATKGRLEQLFARLDAAETAAEREGADEFRRWLHLRTAPAPSSAERRLLETYSERLVALVSSRLIT